MESDTDNRIKISKFYFKIEKFFIEPLFKRSVNVQQQDPIGSMGTEELVVIPKTFFTYVTFCNLELKYTPLIIRLKS